MENDLAKAVLVCGAPGSGKSSVLKLILVGDLRVYGHRVVGVDNEDAFTKEMRKIVGDNVGLPNDDPRLMSKMSLAGQIFLQQMVMASAYRYVDDQVVPQIVLFTSPSENMTSIIKLPGKEIRLFEKMKEDFFNRQVELSVRSLIMLPDSITLEDTLNWDLESAELPDPRLSEIEIAIQKRLKKRSDEYDVQRWLDAPKTSMPNYYWSRLRMLLKTLREIPEIEPIVFDQFTDSKTIAEKVISSIK